MAENVSMEVLETEVMGNSEVEGGNTFKLQARVEKKPKLVHLQQLQQLHLQENELAPSVSALARAFANMTRLEHVRMRPVTCSAASLHMAAQQVRDAVHTLAGQVVAYLWGTQLYDGSSSKAVAQGLDTAWRQVKDKLTTGVAISSRKLKIEFQLLVLDAGDPPPRG
ncbi:hypothetical protein Bbelb_174710 [Branchiostoma belcheri]|nr:hypothetical protein Bbelb_174710 [Branchiostoma belcheri]